MESLRTSFLGNMVYLDRAVRQLRAQGGIVPDDLLAHVAPLGWEHIGLTGDYVWTEPDHDAVSPATRGSCYVSGAGGLACSFEQIVRRPLDQWRWHIMPGDENLTMRAARPTVLPPEALPLLPDAVSMVRRLATGEILFKQGDQASAIYKVESGRLRLIRRTVDDHLVVLHTARSGEFFAEASLFSEVYHCDAIAASASDVRVYAKATLLAALRTEPALSEAFMARLAHQVQELRARMELRNIRSARERVLQYLLLRAGADGRTITIEGQLQDIAAEVGLTREALYRALAGLEAEGVLARVGSVMVLRKSDRA